MTPSRTTANEPYGIAVTDKSTTYLLAAQLAFSHVPGSLLSAIVGWITGYVWRYQLQAKTTGWRVPRWLVGDQRT